MSINVNIIEKFRQFVCSNPTYILVAGDENTLPEDITSMVKGVSASVRKKGRNPVVVGVEGTTVFETASKVAEEIHAHAMCGTVADIIKDIDSRNLRKDHVQVCFLYTPEYAGSEEHLSLLYGVKQFNGTLRCWSNFHHQYTNCKWSAPWVPKYFEKNLVTLNSYSMSEEAKRALFAKRVAYLQKYRSLYKKKSESSPSRNAVPNLPPLMTNLANGPFSDNYQMAIPTPVVAGATV